MKTLLISLMSLLTTLATAQSIQLASLAKPASPPIQNQPTVVTVLGEQAVTLDLENFDRFRRQIMPLIDKMATKQVVGLGEGTHGTREFYKVRYWITKILVEEKGFNNVVFENDYADSYKLNQAMKKASASAIDTLMKQYLIAIWRNQEVKELLSWMQTHNRKSTKPVTFGGIDHMFMTNDAKIVRELTVPFRNAEVDVLTNTLVKLAVTRDSIWYSANRKDFILADSISNKNIVQGYETAEKIHSGSGLVLRYFFVGFADI